eukprot:365008-Chlamydomonas_euryale.AAC.2
MEGTGVRTRGGGGGQGECGLGSMDRAVQTAHTPCSRMPHCSASSCMHLPSQALGLNGSAPGWSKAGHAPAFCKHLDCTVLAPRWLKAGHAPAIHKHLGLTVFGLPPWLRASQLPASCREQPQASASQPPGYCQDCGAGTSHITGSFTHPAA